MLRSAIGKRLDLLPLSLYGNHQRSTWSIGWLRNGTRRHLLGSDSDLIHLQWIGQGFVPIKAIGRLHCPIAGLFEIHGLSPEDATILKILSYLETLAAHAPNYPRNENGTSVAGYGKPRGSTGKTLT